MQKLISSSVYKDDFQKLKGLANKLDCGIELSRFPLCATEDEKNAAIAVTKRNLADFSKEITLHAFFFDLNVVSRDPDINRISVLRFNQSFEIAKELSIKTVLFHSGFNDFKHIDYQLEFLERSIGFWKEFIKQFEDNGMIAVIENVLEDTPAKVLNIIENVNSPNLKVSLDTGHANLYSDIPVNDWIHAYKDKLHHMHLHNNPGNDDAHHSILDGSLNFMEVLNIMKQENVHPKVVFEIFDEKAVVESVEYFNKFFEAR